MKIVWFLCLILAAFPLMAEQKPEDYLSMDLSELMQVEITGSTLTSENIKTVPSAVTVFAHAEIQRMGLDTLDELMNIVPGFQSYRSSFSSLHNPFSSRGRRIGNPSSEVLILMDGQRIEEPRSSGSSVVAPKIPLMNIERVEFIRGPGATVYGSNAMMGVINIITRSGANEVSVSYGSFNRRQAYLLASHQIGDVAVDVFGHIEEDDGDDYRVQDTFSPNRIDTDDPRKLADLNIKLRWHNTRINIQHNQFKTEKFYETDRISNDFNERSAQLSSISVKQDFEWQSVASWVWLSYNRSDFSSNPQFTGPGALAPISNPSSNDPLFVKADFDDFREVRAQWHNDWNINAASNLQLGIEFRHIDAPKVTAKNNFDLGDLANRNFPIRYYGALLETTTIQGSSNRDIIGVYSQYQRQLFKKTRMTLGLRYDDFSSIGSQLSPRFGLVQELGDHHSLKLLYGEAFRAPTENELNLLNNPVVLGNPDLRPETVKSLDLIWVAQWTHTGFSLGYFENHFEDSIVQTSIGGGTLQYANVNQDETRGIEFELSRDLTEHFMLRATYTYISEQSDFSFREADQLASMMIDYQQGNWNANLIAAYQGERDMPIGGSNTNRITLDDYWQIFSKVRYNFNPKWEVFVQAKNLLDENYQTPATNALLTEGVPNRGRELLVGAVWKY